jgi:hypothetical protein
LSEPGGGDDGTEGSLFGFLSLHPFLNQIAAGKQMASWQSFSYFIPCVSLWQVAEMLIWALNRHLLTSEQKPFRRALSKEDQLAFDRLFGRAKMHTSAGVYMANPWPMETILLSICLEHGKLIEEILSRFKERNT